MGYPLWKNVNLSTFSTSCFYRLESWFFVVKYRKRHFSGLYCLKKKVGKMVIFGRIPWVNPFGKMSIFRLFWKSCLFVYSLERHFFLLEYPKRYFPRLYCLKRKVLKIAIFSPKPWLNPFRKMTIFSINWTSCFYNLQSRFFVVKCGKRHFPRLNYLKKKWWKNGHFWTKTISYPIWKYVNFSTFRTFCFSSLERCFLVLEYRNRHFPCLYCLKTNFGKMAIFGPKTMG